jgi:hypothetical protein
MTSNTAPSATAATYRATFRERKLPTFPRDAFIEALPQQTIKNCLEFSSKAARESYSTPANSVNAGRCPTFCPVLFFHNLV